MSPHGARKPTVGRSRASSGARTSATDARARGRCGTATRARGGRAGDFAPDARTTRTTRTTTRDETSTASRKATISPSALCLVVCGILSCGVGAARARRARRWAAAREARAVRARIERARRETENQARERARIAREVERVERAREIARADALERRAKETARRVAERDEAERRRVEREREMRERIVASDRCVYVDTSDDDDRAVPKRGWGSYYPSDYDEPYCATTTTTTSETTEGATEARDVETRKVQRKEQRVKYFALVSSRNHGTSVSERREIEEEFARRVSSLDAKSRVFETASLTGVDAKLYTLAARHLRRERYVDAMAGDGAFSDVFMTHHASDAETAFFGDEDAVLKCSNPFPGVVGGGKVGDGYRIGAVEAMTLSSMPKHPHIVRIFAGLLERARNESYLLLSAAGRNAHDMRERGELTPRQSRELARELVHAMAHCHANGVVHRDIKPGNVLLSPGAGANTFRATLIDFGVARQPIIQDAYHASLYGTPGYQSPELLLSDMNGVDDEQWTKVDVFAFGATCFFLCAGRELFGYVDDETGEIEPKRESKTKVKRVTMALLRQASRLFPDGGAGAASDAVIVNSMLRFADMKLSRSHEKRYRDVFGVDPPSASSSKNMLERYVIDVVSATQPRPFAELVARCLAYDPSARPSAREILAHEEAWLGVEDDADVLGWDYAKDSGAVEINVDATDSLANASPVMNR